MNRHKKSSKRADRKKFTGPKRDLTPVEAAELEELKFLRHTGDFNACMASLKVTSEV